MKRPTDIEDIFSRDSARQFEEILRDAITDYAEKRDSMQTDEWLKSYMRSRLIDKNVDEVEEICLSILEAVKTHTEKTASMKTAFEKGESAENWFVKDVMSSGGSPGEVAKEVIECDAALVEISNSFEDEEYQQDVVDVEVIPTDEWADDKWNSYRLKDALRETAADAARVALHNAADDMSAKIMQYGLESVLSDRSLISDSLLCAADNGLKVATAGAVSVAADRQVIAISPKAAHAETIANIAGLAVENMQILSQVGSGEISSTEGMVMMKNNTMVTVANTFGQRQGASIGASIGTAFGPVGTAVGGFIGGAVGKYVGTEIGLDIVSGNSKILNAAKKAVSAVGNVVKSVGNTIKNFFSNFI